MTERPPRILYVDDDAGLRRLAERAMSRRGFEVVPAGSGDEAIARAETELFDLVAVDHYMPGRDGLATMKALQTMRNCPPIVFVTGSDETQVAVAALKQGASDYVVKSAGEHFFDLLETSFRQALEQLKLRRAKEAAEEKLRASNMRLQALLHEVNHRVANSLQLVSAFVHMQAALVRDPSASSALVETQKRIQAVAQVHRRLYSSEDGEAVTMDGFLENFVGELEQTWSTPIARRRLRLDAEPLRLKPDRAVSVGVVVNELVSNACKYAYPESAHGEVRIALRREGDGAFLLIVEDDGCGLPADGSVQGTGLGSRLVEAMAASLGGRIGYEPAEPGLRATLRAPIEAAARPTPAAELEDA